MAVDIERLIESLIDDVSCYGDLGCSVSHILSKVDQFYPSNAPYDVLVISPRQAVWDWVRGRCDISIGHNREWNHAILSEILLLPEETPPVADQPNSAGPGVQISKQEDRTVLPPLNPTPGDCVAVQYRPKVYVSEEQMWQSIAGHGADFKRIPKLEWAALVGIASTKKEGILQGDLCRLIGQDKRSLPRRTDSLAQKGYILKRTTLVRGVKTSKMWLSRYAPSLSLDRNEFGDGGRTPQDAPSSMSPENLNRDMEPVAWRTRWTGKAIDMLSLAETVISIVKAFGIMRYHDLRQKLGILNLPWQMKVTARLCRWAVRRGILQYVGATLGDRLYKDCLKFTRDFTSEDWTEWLRTGKEKARPKTDADLDAYRDNPNDDTSAKRKKNKRAANSINVMVAWKPEKPLATTVLDAIRAADARAVTNRYLGAHTLGPPFSRYVTSISTTLATPSLQPKHLAHFQVSKELLRVKKQAIYFFSLPCLHATTDTLNVEGKDTTESMLASSQGERPRFIEPVLSQNVDCYFSPLTLKEVNKGLRGLTVLSQMADSRHRVVSGKTTTRPAPPPPSGGPTTPDIGPRAGDEVSSRIVLDVGSSQAISMVTRQMSGHSRGRRGRKTTTLVLTIRVSPSSLATILSHSGLELPSNGRLINAGHAGSPSEPQPLLSMGSFESSISEKKEDRSRGQEVPCSSDSQNSPSGRHQKSLHTDGHDSRETFAETTSAGTKDEDHDDDMENPQPTLPDPTERVPKKKGRPKGAAAAASQNPRASKAGAFRCDKCGGVWRNDNGLKYHLEKSSSACNPSYIPPPPKPPRYLSARKVLLSNLHTPDPDAAIESPRRRTRNSAADATAGSPSTQATNNTRQAARGSSAFQHAPTLRTRSQYLCLDPAGQAKDIGVGNTVLQPLKCPDSFSAFQSEPALSPFNALIRNTTATLTNVSWGSPVEATDSLFSSHNAPTSTPNPLNLPDSHSREPLNASGKCDDREELDDARAVAVVKHKNTDSATLTSPLEPTIGTPPFEARLDDIIPDVKQLPVLGQTPQTVQFRMPAKTDKPRIFGHRHNSQLHRSSEIIQYLLDIHGGVIPGDRSLWHALTAVWEKTFSTDTPPNYGTTQGVVGKMVSKKVVRKSVHAFRDPKGSFKSVTLLLAPHVDSQALAALEVKDKMIAAHPKTYLLPGYTPASGLPDDTKWNGIPVFSTRRQLAQGVEVLDAPFYASRQVSRKRPRGVDSTEKASRKRLKKENLKNVSVISEDETPSTRGAHRVFVGGYDAEPLHSQIPGALTFLEPNTRLDEDAMLLEQHLRSKHHAWPNSDGSTTSKAAVLGNTNGAMKERQVIGQSRVQFVEPALVVRNGDTWPHLRADFFEGSFSATMKGRLSDVPQTHIHLPRSLSDIMGAQWSKPPPVAPETVHRFFMNQIEKCKLWETDTDRVAQLVAMNSVAPNYIWINHIVNIATCARSYRKLTWAMESPGPLPEQAAECFQPPVTRQGQSHSTNSSPPKRLRGDESISRSTTAVLPMDLKTRKMTPWTGPAEDGQPLSQAHRLDGNNDAVLIAAFVATRTLLGGADKYVEWGLLLRLFPSKSLAWLRKFWSKARRDRAATINKLTERFQERFVKAYEQNELPMIDFDDYLSYDWPSLVEWTLDLAGDAIKLPSSRAELDREYAMDSLTADTSDWQRIYYSFQSSTFNRLEALTSGSTCTPVDKTEAMPISTNEAELSKAKSWLRALCGTKSGTYKPADIRQKLCSITEHGDIHNNDLLGRAIAALQNQNVITKTKHRSSESGSHRFTEWFMPRFEKTSQAHKYNDAVSFKAMLDRVFMKNKPWRVPYLLQDGEVMAMINMQAAGRIKVTPVDIPHIPLGFKPGFYESRKFPKSFYNFGLEVTPTDTYIYNVDLSVLEAARQDPPIMEGPEGKLPIWSDIFGKLCADRWGQTLRAITFTVAMRGPMGVEGILSALAPFLEDFEIELAIEWGLRNQILKKTAHGGTYTADEWWWLLAGAQYHELLIPVGSGNQQNQPQ